MKKLFGFWNVLLFASAAMFLTSCEDETVVDPTTPTITETHAFDATKDQDAGTTIALNITGKVGGAPLNSIKIDENNTVLSKDRFKVDNQDVASETVGLFGADKQGFTKIVSITLPITSGKYKYTITLTDENQKSDAVSVEVNVAGLVVIQSDKVYNILGPYAGGLNLNTGKSVLKGSDTDQSKQWVGAHFLDNGNSGNAENHPWKKEIISWHASDMREVAASVNFDNVVSESEIKSIYDAGTTKLSIGLSVGKVFAVHRDNTYFLVRVKSVVDDGKNSGNDSNIDYSEFEIKKKG